MEQAQCQLSVLWTMVETFPFYQHGGYQAVRPQAKVYRCGAADAKSFADLMAIRWWSTSRARTGPKRFDAYTNGSLTA